MEYSQINALFKRNHNDYELWNLTLPREKIQKIRQVQEDISGDLRQIFEELPLDDGQMENKIHFALPHQDGRGSSPWIWARVLRTGTATMEVLSGDHGRKSFQSFVRL